MVETEIRLSSDKLPAIRATLAENMIQRATTSLLVWGLINLVAWLFFGGSDRQILGGLENPGTQIYLLMYGGLAISVAMLFFAALGFTTKLSLLLLLDGIALIIVGIWNFAGVLVAISALKPYGYTIEPNKFWMYLGAFQIIWGIREFAKFRSVTAWEAVSVPGTEKDDAKRVIAQLIKEKEDPGSGIVKASKNPGLLEFIGKQYSGEILGQTLMFVAKDDYFTINKEGVQRATWGNIWRNKRVNPWQFVVNSEEGKKRVLILGPLSLLIIKRWANVPVSSADIAFLSTGKKATIELLSPFIDGNNTELKSAAVGALVTIDSTDSQRIVLAHLSDREPSVRIAAIKAATKLKMRDAQVYLPSLLNDTHNDVKKAAAGLQRVLERRVE